MTVGVGQEPSPAVNMPVVCPNMRVAFYSNGVVTGGVLWLTSIYCFKDKNDLSGGTWLPGSFIGAPSVVWNNHLLWATMGRWWLTLNSSSLLYPLSSSIHPISIYILMMTATVMAAVTVGIWAWVLWQATCLAGDKAWVAFGIQWLFKKGEKKKHFLFQHWNLA